jgi:proteasome assembly chaperone (PAC2) family protein
MELLQIPNLRSPVMVIAFSGWNDAAEAATGTVTHLMNSWSNEDPELMAEVNPEEFYDFQVNRPLIGLDESGSRSLTWPGTQVFAVRAPELEHDFVIVRGVEPSLKWKTFAHEILDLADDLEVDLIISVGSMLADAPHSRPISVMSTCTNPDLAKRFNIEVSKYEGPTGILGVIADACLRRGTDAVSLWAAVPHYASSSPSPKVSLALINSLEDVLEISIPVKDLGAKSLAWENEVNALMAEDTEINEYVKALEESKDSKQFSDVSGDEIARELSRFLRRQSDN